MDIQIKFLHPKNLTKTVSEPDELKIVFKNSAMFMDEVEFE